MLVTGKEILQKAFENGFGVGAFNTSNLEITKAVIEAAEEMKSPVLLQVSQGGMTYAGVENIANLVRTMAQNASVPVALHLDHGTDMEFVYKALRAGWTSVMMDGSHHEYEENVALTKRVVEVAHGMGVSVEAELGTIGGVEEQVVVKEEDVKYTDPVQAEDFAKRTGIDYLAVAVGNAHGMYHGTPKLQFDIIEETRKRINIPIVLHGGSGIPDEDFRKAVSLGVAKINIDTEMRIAFINKIKEVLEAKPNEIDPRKVLGPAKDAVKAVVKHKMEVFGSAGKAELFK